MLELSDDIYQEIQRLCQEGNNFESSNLEQALSCFQKAWEFLPEPKTNWSAALWILVAIGDIQFQRGEFAAGRQALMTAMKYFNEALGNPFIRLRLGQCMYELGEMQEAANWLTGAFIREGVEIFGDDNPKYVEFVKARLKTE
jgi:tetratricopeptide (TPR) repeat protein